MSHVVSIDIQITDLDALKSACKELGFEFRENQTTFKWFGRHVGDYKLPEGFKKEDMGHCEHAIHVPGADYEVGIVKNRAKGKEGYTFMLDFYAGGGGLVDAIGGQDAHKLIQMYATHKAEKALKSKGYKYTRKTLKGGAIQIVASV